MLSEFEYLEVLELEVNMQFLTSKVYSASTNDIFVSFMSIFSFWSNAFCVNINTLLLPSHRELFHSHWRSYMFDWLLIPFLSCFCNTIQSINLLDVFIDICNHSVVLSTRRFTFPESIQNIFLFFSGIFKIVIESWCNSNRKWILKHFNIMVGIGYWETNKREMHSFKSSCSDIVS